MKILLILCDGIGDRLTDGRTPLEVAETPHMDKMATEGITGIMDTVRAGVRPGSDTSHLSLFGYDPFKVYTGRGPFEAMGVDLKLREGDIAIRCNFATMKNGRIVDRRAGREEEGLADLAKELHNLTIGDTGIIFKKCAGHRAVLVLRGKKLSSAVTDTDPEESNAPWDRSISTDGKEESERTAQILNEFTQKSIDMFQNHSINKRRVGKGKLPANIVLSRGAGIKPELESFEERYGIRGACISATTLIRGVCSGIGMHIIDVPGATGHVDSDIEGKARAAINALKKYDFVFLHIKGTDEASHDGNFQRKKGVIERIDREVIKPILEDVEDTAIALTGDHSTPVGIMQHSADPVPVAIIGDVRTDSVKRFDERSCSKGGMNRICGRDLMGILLDLSNNARLFGA